MFSFATSLPALSACPSLTGLHAPIRPNITHSWGVASVALSVQCVILVPGILDVYCTPYVNPPTDRLAIPYKNPDDDDDRNSRPRGVVQKIWQSLGL